MVILLLFYRINYSVVQGDAFEQRPDVANYWRHWMVAIQWANVVIIGLLKIIHLYRNKLWLNTYEKENALNAPHSLIFTTATLTGAAGPQELSKTMHIV